MQANPFKRFEQVLEDAEDEFSHARVRLGGESGAAAVDVAGSDGEFVVTCDLPGFEAADLDLRVTDSTLHIHAEHEAKAEFESEDYLHRERRRTDVSPLPADVDEDEVSVTYENGVSTVTLPKQHADTDDAHRIPVS